MTEDWKRDVEARLRKLEADSHPPIDLTPLVEDVVERRTLSGRLTALWRWWRTPGSEQ